MSQPRALLGRAADLVALGRPLFLVGGAVFYGQGVAAAHAAGAPVDWTAAIAGQLAVTGAQLMTHYSNDYFDLDADRANTAPTAWSSGSRVLVEGRVSPATARTAMLACVALALAGALAAVAASPARVPTLVLLLAALALAWGYSGPPLWLNRRGLGEVSGALLVPGLTGLLGYQLQVGAVDAAIVLAVAPLCLLQFAMLLVVGIPDVAGDRAVGKGTLPVRLGGGRAAGLYLAALGAAYGVRPILALAGLSPLVAAAPVATLPIAIWLAARMVRGAWADRSAWAAQSFWTIGALVGSAGLQLLAFLV